MRIAAGIPGWPPSTAWPRGRPWELDPHAPARAGPVADASIPGSFSPLADATAATAAIEWTTAGDCPGPSAGAEKQDAADAGIGASRPVGEIRHLRPGDAALGGEAADCGPVGVPGGREVVPPAPLGGGDLRARRRDHPVLTVRQRTEYRVARVLTTLPPRAQVRLSGAPAGDSGRADARARGAADPAVTREGRRAAP